MEGRIDHRRPQEESQVSASPGHAMPCHAAMLEVIVARGHPVAIRWPSGHLRSRTVALHLQSSEARRLGLLHLNLRRCLKSAFVRSSLMSFSFIFLELLELDVLCQTSPVLCAKRPGEHSGSVVAKGGRFSPRRSTSNRCLPQAEFLKTRQRCRKDERGR